VSPAKGPEGRLFGASFEKALQLQGRSNGLLVLQNKLTAIPLGGGGVRVLKSELDFTLARKADGRVAFVDAKTYATDYFDYSNLLSKKPPHDHQIQRAALYNEFGVPSGFVCWFRPPCDQIVFFSGRQVLMAGPGTRFRPQYGLFLGRLNEFDLRRVFNV
jgi:hypothetical protein